LSFEASPLSIMDLSLLTSVFTGVNY
jgi:hypothetical protein